jgi:hypothetical protein
VGQTDGVSGVVGQGEGTGQGGQEGGVEKVTSGHVKQVGEGIGREGQEGQGSGGGQVSGGGHEGHSVMTGEGSGVEVSLRQDIVSLCSRCGLNPSKF